MPAEASRAPPPQSDPAAPGPEAAWLDEASAWADFSRPLPGPRLQGTGEPRLWESQVGIQGMVCAACALNVEDALRRLPGVHEVRVSAAARRASIRWDAALVRPSTWMQAVQGAGYRAVPVADASETRLRRSESRTALWCWLVAGLCMMQVMMYAAPAYLTAPGEISADAQSLMRWASWVLTLPVLLFSSKPFFASAWRDVRHGRIGMDVPVALGILIAFVASSIATFDPTSPLAPEVWYDSLTMFVFFLLSGRMLEQRLRERTAGALDALMQRLPASVERQQPDGSFARVAVARLAPGNTVRVLPGEAFPADGVLLGGRTQVDEALLTGESRPVLRGPGDTVIAGSHNLAAPVDMRVEHTGEATRYAGIVALMQQAALHKPALAQLADRIARPFLVAVLLAAFGAAAWWWQRDPAHAVAVAIAVLVVTCPCALSLATPSAALAAAGALARRGVLVRQLQVFEALERVDTVVFDKTGTLTHDHLALGDILTRPGVTPAQALRWAGALGRNSLHPVSRALATAAGADTPLATALRELPGQGMQGRIVVPASGGSTSAPLPMGTEGAPGAAASAAPVGLLRLGSASFCDAPAAPESPQRAWRVHLADEAGWIASFALAEGLRPDAAASLAVLQSRGLRVSLLSGDAAPAVAQTAAQLGLPADQALGARRPEDKLAHLGSLQDAGHHTAMVGDGLNDSPVLARADVSIAIGQAVPVAQARADVVIPGGQLAGLPLLWEVAARTRRIVRQNLAWAAAYNLASVPLAVAGWMPPWLAGLGMAASSLLVIANAARLAKLPAAATQPVQAPPAPVTPQPVQAVQAAPSVPAGAPRRPPLPPPRVAT